MATTACLAIAEPGYSQRYELGLDVMKTVRGPSHALPLNSLQPVVLDLARFLVEFAYAAVMSLPALHLKKRSLQVTRYIGRPESSRPLVEVNHDDAHD